MCSWRGEKKKHLCICYQTLLCCRNGGVGRKRTHCLETTATERSLTRTTRSLCMHRRQGIGFENKQVHDFTSTLRTKQKGATGSGEDKHVMKFSAAGKSGLKLLRAFKRTKEMSTKQQKMLAFPWSSKISTASDANIICITLTSISSLSAERTAPSTHTCHLPHGCLRQTPTGRRRRWNGAASLVGFFFSPLAEMLRRRTAISKWCSLFVLFSAHACPPPPPFFSITPAIMTFEERKEWEAALWCIPPLILLHVDNSKSETYLLITD